MAVEEGNDEVSLRCDLEGMGLREEEVEERRLVPSGPSASDISNFLSACGSLNHRHIRDTVERHDPNELTDASGQNGFHYVICSVVHNPSKQSSILKYFVKRGLDINKARSTDGWTPIFLAVTFGYIKIVSLLLSKGAKVNINDADSQTPEDLASKYRMTKIRDTLIHHRYRVPHSRFSCVLSGPALSSPPSSGEQEETTTTTTGDDEPNSSNSTLPEAAA